MTTDAGQTYKAHAVNAHRWRASSCIKRAHGNVVRRQLQIWQRSVNSFAKVGLPWCSKYEVNKSHKDHQHAFQVPLLVVFAIDTSLHSLLLSPSGRTLQFPTFLTFRTGSLT